MQSSIADDDSVIDGIQKSLFHVLEDKSKAAGKRDCVHRAVIALKLNTSSQNLEALFPNLKADFSKNNVKTLLGQHYDPDGEGVLKTFSTGPEDATGLLLMYPHFALHVLEATGEVIQKVVEELHRFASEEEAPVVRSVILNISHNIQNRLFPFWSHAILEVEPVNVDLFESNDPDENLMASIVTQLIKLGVHLQKDANKGRMNEIMKRVREERPELVPSQAAVGYLAQNCEDPCLLSCLEYLDVYRVPFDAKLASDYEWPLFSNIFSYTD